MRRSSPTLATLCALLLIVAVVDAKSYNYDWRQRRAEQHYADQGARAHYGEHIADHYHRSEIEIDTYPGEQTVHSGQEVVIECTVRGHGNYDVTWSKVGGPLPRNARTHGGQLTVHSIEERDQGQYVCIVEIEERGRVTTLERYATVNVHPYGPVAEQRRGAISGRVCRSDEKTCRNGECIQSMYICDGQQDCSDGSDEMGCSANQGGGGAECEPNEKRCNNGNCVQRMWWCDGEDDCQDGSDEAQCGGRQQNGCLDTEWQCEGSTQCIPKAFQCDGTNDCPGGVDEQNCNKPTVTIPPPPGKQVNRGETIILKCTAVGRPTPVINWRKNWGPVCDGPRCTQTSVDGVGTLTINNAELGDAGAYTCEAINIVDRLLVVPDCIVSVGEASQCNPAGTLRTRPDGTCECKKWVTGPRCDQCMRNAFYFHQDNPNGCINCFCSGVTEDCSSSTYHRTTKRVGFANGRADNVQITNLRITQTEQSPVFEFPERGWVQYSTGGSATQYWRLSKAFGLTDDLVTLYGGHIEFKFKYTGSGSPSTDPLLVLKGNLITLYFIGEQSYSADREHTIRVRIMEHHLHNDGRKQKTNREHVIMALSDLDEILIRATHANGQYSSSLSEVSLEIAVDRDTQGERAHEVEQCRCPPEYVGLSCEDCAPGYERTGGGLYLGTCGRAQTRCNPAGTLSESNGVCQCKPYVTGQYCDQCAANAFFLDAGNPNGCIQCFCSGITKDCRAANMYRHQHKIDFASGASTSIKARTSHRIKEMSVTPRAQPRIENGGLTLTDFGETGEKPLFFELSSAFIENKLTSYGGSMRVTFKFSGYGDASRAPLIQLTGNDITLKYMHPQSLAADQEHTVEVKFFETSWQRADGEKTTREHLLMALADVDEMLIRANHVAQTTSSTLVRVEMDYAAEVRGGELVQTIEQCMCDAGYKGLSCEECADGYKRTGGGLYLGTCERCECNGHATSCNPFTGVCINCVHNTHGDHCEMCLPGYTGDARRGTPTDCTLIQEAPAPCECNNHSPRGCDSNNPPRCIQCEDFTEGRNCESCKPGYYGDATQGTKYDCTPCPCPANVDCYLNADNEPVCKNCPAGYTGRLCDVCAPGYTEDRQEPRDDPRFPKCKPIGQHGPGHIDYANNRFHKHNPEWRHRARA